MNLIFIKDNIVNLDLKPKAKGNKTYNTGNKANKIGGQLAPHDLGIHFPPI